MRINSSAGQKGRRATSQRTLLLKLIEEARGHVDAKELYRRAAERNADISLATVYRSLNLFREQGLIEERRFGRVRCRYYEVRRGGEHHHLVCRGCGRVIDLESPVVGDLVAEVRQQCGFDVVGIQLSLDGYCGECRN